MISYEITNQGARQMIGGHPIETGKNTISYNTFEMMAHKSCCGSDVLMARINIEMPIRRIDDTPQATPIKMPMDSNKWTAAILADMGIKDLRIAARPHGIKGSSKEDLRASLEGKEVK